MVTKMQDWQDRTWYINDRVIYNPRDMPRSQGFKLRISGFVTKGSVYVETVEDATVYLRFIAPISHLLFDRHATSDEWPCDGGPYPF